MVEEDIARGRNPPESLSRDSSHLLMDTGTADIFNEPLQLNISTHCVEPDSLDLRGKKSNRKTKSSSSQDILRPKSSSSQDIRRTKSSSSQDILRPKSSKQKHSSVKQKKPVQKWFDIPISRLRTQDLARSQETNDELEKKNVDLMKEIVILQKHSQRLQTLCEYLSRGGSFHKPCKSGASRPTNYRTSDDTETRFSIDGSSQVKMQGAGHKPFEDPNVLSLLDMQESQDFVDLVEPNRGITTSCFHGDSSISGWRKLTDSCTIRNSSYDDRSSSTTSPIQSATDYGSRFSTIIPPIQSATDYGSRSSSITSPVQSATDYGLRSSSITSLLQSATDYGSRSSSITSPVQSVTDYGSRSSSITSPVESATDYGSRSSSITSPMQSATDYGSRNENAETCANIKSCYLPTTQNYVDPNLNDVIPAYYSNTLGIANTDLDWPTQKSYHTLSLITKKEKSMLLRSISTKDENLNHTVARSPDYLSPVSPTRHCQSTPESPDSGILIKSPSSALFLDGNSELFIKEETPDNISSSGNFIARDNEYLAVYMRDSPTRTISKRVGERRMNSSEGDDIRSCYGQSEWKQRREGLSQTDDNKFKTIDRPMYITQSLHSDPEAYRLKDAEEFIKKEEEIDSIVKDLMSPIIDEMTSECEVFNFVASLENEHPKDARADNLAEHHANREGTLSELRQSNGLTSNCDQLVTHDQVPLITNKMSKLSCRSPDCLSSP